MQQSKQSLWKSNDLVCVVLWDWFTSPINTRTIVFLLLSFFPLVLLRLYLIRYKKIKACYLIFHNEYLELKKSFSSFQFSFWRLQAAANHYVFNFKTSPQVSLCWFIYKSLQYLIRLLHLIEMLGRKNWAIYFCNVSNCLFSARSFRYSG